jgi:hypothetical protein
MAIATGAGTGDQSRDFSLNTPDGPPGGGASPSTLAGESGPAAPSGNAPAESDEGLKQAVQSVRQIQVQIMDLAKQFPAASSSLRTAATGLRAALRQIVANPGSPEPPSPSIGG